MGDIGTGLADPKSKEFQQLAKVIEQIDGETLLTGVSALQTIKRTGQSALKKNRILAVTKAAGGRQPNLYILKKENNSVKWKSPLKAGTLQAEKDHDLTLRTDDEVMVFSLRAESERDYFLATCERYMRESRRNFVGTLEQRIELGQDTPSPSRNQAPITAEEKKGLLTQADDDALAVILKRYEKLGTNDARQLRDHVNTATARLQRENAAAIVHGEKEWAELVENFEDMAFALSGIQMRLVQLTNNLEKKSEKISIVEKERADRETVHQNYDKLLGELEDLTKQLEPAADYIKILNTCGFTPLQRTRIIEAINWAKMFDKKNLAGTYHVSAVSETIQTVTEAKKMMADRLVAYLEEDFKQVGANLKSLSLRRAKLSSGQLKIRSRNKYHSAWLQLTPLMPPVLDKGMTVVMRLCRTYAAQMKLSYRQEIHGYFKEVRGKLLRKKHKSVFFIGAGMDELKGLELLTELNQNSFGSSYAASEAPTMLSVAKSHVSGASDDAGEEETSILNDLGIQVYRGSGVGAIGSVMGGSDKSPFGGSSRRSSRAGSFSMGSEGGGSISGQSNTVTDKEGKERIPPHVALIQPMISCVEIVLGEQRFLERMFGLTTDHQDTDTDMTPMISHMFCISDTVRESILTCELKETVAYIKKECDMMSLIPASIVASMLQEEMASRSQVLSDVLSQARGDIKDAIHVWQEQQLKTVSKYKTDIKHCTVLPCFIRFKLFMKRIESMCAPIPLSAQFDSIQTIVEVICKEMFSRLEELCETDAKYRDFFYIKNLTYFLEFIKDKKANPTGLTNKLLSKQFEAIDKLEKARKDRERDYIVNTLMQDIFLELFTFVADAERCLAANSNKADELGMHQNFNHTRVEGLLGQTKLKTVQSHISSIYKRQNKHFFEHTTSRDQFINVLFHTTWEATKAHILDHWTRLESLLARCYQKLLPKFGCDTANITAILEKQNLGGV
eukprot:TRINITY_DN19784_c0_g2_i3.p1 TRINITY_DN19784_c0_g2~~TRINITY_DN19784_c0_g2_i3.p1  ORF type:complete len:970 (+),score=369.30 TRINITY_DN19784_c0_g2_i3:32-2911(+)